MRKALLIVLLTIPLGAICAPLQTVVIAVQNMTCELCPITVRKSLERVSGVADARIDFATKTATVKFDPDRTNVAALVAATTHAGYPSTPRR